MSMTELLHDGGGAFPHKPSRTEPTSDPRMQIYHHGDHPGMSLRDYFAAHAMSGMFAAFKHWPKTGEVDSVVRYAFQAADAMLKARGAA